MRKIILLFVVLFSVGSFAQNSKLKGYNSVCKNPIYLKALGGTFEVGVNIGSVIKLPFILDTGASECVIPAYVAMTLYKNGLITKADFLDDKIYSLADGSEVRCRRIVIRKLVIGKYLLKNVEFAVSPNADAPLLLGQNALKKLGNVSINYSNNTICVN